MKTIRKYQTGAALVAGGAGTAGGEALMTAPGLAIPAALALAMYNTYKYPERTAMSRGMRAAEENWRAAQAQLEAEERAQVKAAAIAHNKQLAEYYARELSKGPIVRNYTNGFTTTITGYDPNTGRLTTVMNDPNREWTYEGTAPELRYNYLNGVNLEDELNGVVTTKYGTFTPEIDYVDWDTLKIKPGTLIEGLPGIALAPPTGLNSVKINPRAMVLSTGQTVALPSDITDYRVFDESEDASGGTFVFDDSGDADAGAGTGAGTGSPGSPRRNDDDDDNQISSVEEYIRRFGKNMSRQTARRLRKSERVSHDANGNINHRATRLLNRGANGGAGGTGGAKSGGFSWQSFLWGTTLGGGLPFIYQSIFGDKEEAKPDVHGDVEYTERAGGAIDQVVEGDTTVSTKRDSLKTEKTDWDQYFFPQE